MGDKRTPRMSDLASGTDGHPGVAWWRAAAIGGGGLALAIGALAMLWFLVEPLMLVLIAIIIAQALMPVVAWLERWLPRALATVAVYLVLMLMLVGLGWLILPRIFEQAQRLVDDAPTLVDQARQWLDSVDPEASSRVVNAMEMLVSRFSDALLSLPLTLFSSAIDFVLVIFMSIYWLIAAPALMRFTLSLFPEERRDRAAGVLGAMGQTMGGFVRGEVIDAIVVACLTFVGLTVIGVQYTLVLAILVGFGELLPVIGPIITAIPAVLVALLDSPEKAIITGVFFIVLQQVESNLLLPLVMRHQADVPPLLSLVAILAGSTLGGLLGAIIAIPLAGALRIMVVRVLAPAERDWTGVYDAQTEVGARPGEEGAG